MLTQHVRFLTVATVSMVTWPPIAPPPKKKIPCDWFRFRHLQLIQALLLSSPVPCRCVSPGDFFVKDQSAGSENDWMHKQNGRNHASQILETYDIWNHERKLTPTTSPNFHCNRFIREKHDLIKSSYSSWWFQPIWNILVRLDHFPKKRGEHYKKMSCHYQDMFPITNQGTVAFCICFFKLFDMIVHNSGEATSLLRRFVFCFLSSDAAACGYCFPRSNDAVE